MTDKWLVTAEGYYEAGGSVQHAFWGEFQNSFLFGFVRKAKKNQNKNKKCLIATQSAIPSFIWKYVTEQREGGDEVVFWLVV